MIFIQESETTYDIKSSYDLELIDRIKNVPGRLWNPETKIWTIPKDKLGFFLNQIKGTRWESQVYIDSSENINENSSLDSTPSASVPDIDISDAHLYVQEGSRLYQHQIDFLKYAINRERHNNFHGFICADAMGVGKTIEGINLALYNKEHYGFQHCLIICCVNSAKYSWTSDINKHTNGQLYGYILGSRMKSRTSTVDTNGGTKEKLEDLVSDHMFGDKSQPNLPYFIITNIESLRGEQNTKMVIYDELLRWINDGKISMIILDEVHKNTSPSSTQGKMILKLKDKAKKLVMYLPMTGTPITKRPTDLFLPLKLIDAHRWKSYYMWSQNFCIFGGYGDHDVIGYKNIPQLKKMLEDNMIRRRRDEVLDLPEKIQITEYVDNTMLQMKLYNQIAADMIENKESIINNLNPLSKFFRLRQANGSPELIDHSIQIDKNYVKKNAKLARLLELLEDIHERGEKVVIFSNWVEPLRTLYTYITKFTKYKCCVYTGTMKSDAREKHKRVFINNPDYMILMGTVGALGVSHTLTVANNVIFIDEPWNPSDKVQAEDRCHRIGTTQSVNIYTIITRNTVDDRVHDVLATKQGISNYIVDNELDIRKNPQLFDLLFRDSIKTRR